VSKPVVSRPVHSARIAVNDIGTSPTVLLLVDFVNPLDFEGADDLSASAVEAARAVAALRRRFGRDGFQTVYANDNYGIWRADFKEIWTRCRRRKGPSSEMALLLRPGPQDFTILKPRHSAFYSTPLGLLLTQLKCRRLVVTGLAADNCVLFTAMDAYLRGYALWIPADCVAAESEEAKSQALDQMRRVLKADVRPALATRGRA